MLFLLQVKFTRLNGIHSKLRHGQFLVEVIEFFSEVFSNLLSDDKTYNMKENPRAELSRIVKPGIKYKEENTGKEIQKLRKILLTVKQTHSLLSFYQVEMLIR